MSSIQKPTRDRLGDSLTALCGGALALNLLLILALLGILLANGGGHFWQEPLEELTLADGRVLLGEIHERKPVAAREGVVADPDAQRIQLKVGNRDLTGIDFIWLDESAIVSRSRPLDAVLLERLEWGNFYGRMVELRRGEELLAAGSEAVWEAFAPLHEEKTRERHKIRKLEKGPIGDVNQEIEKLRLARRKVELAEPKGPAREARIAAIDEAERKRQVEYEALAEQLFSRRAALNAEIIVLEAADGRRKELPVGAVVRALRPNTYGLLDKVALNASRLREFILDDPRESNTEGGIFPAI
ncbi:MAG TPA: phosphate ABC transporter, permease protein PstA, partial [Thermoanaerobaculia bacterium]|nr:phosphate ABC transporter, permease protein PstA [Thermoanaerobaculia bacterium]